MFDNIISDIRIPLIIFALISALTSFAWGYLAWYLMKESNIPWLMLLSSVILNLFGIIFLILAFFI